MRLLLGPQALGPATVHGDGREIAEVARQGKIARAQPLRTGAGEHQGADRRGPQAERDREPGRSPQRLAAGERLANVAPLGERAGHFIGIHPAHEGVEALVVLAHEALLDTER